MTEAVWVNKGPNVPTRCEQNLNCYAVNLVTNQVADALGLDPIEVALKNDGAEGHDIDWLNERKAELGFPVRDSLRECVEKGKAAIDWDKKRHAPGAKRLPNGRMHGLGFTWTHEWDDSAGTSEMAMYVERNDGTVTILGCRADGGQNAETTYCQIAADELGFRGGGRPLQAPGRRRLLHHDPRHLHQPDRQRLGGAARRPHAQAEDPGDGREPPRGDAAGQLPAGLPRTSGPTSSTSRTA